AFRRGSSVDLNDHGGGVARSAGERRRGVVGGRLRLVQGHPRRGRFHVEGHRFTYSGGVAERAFLGRGRGALRARGRGAGVAGGPAAAGAGGGRGRDDRAFRRGPCIDLDRDRGGAAGGAGERRSRVVGGRGRLVHRHRRRARINGERPCFA